jgi:hypothetical protein
MKKTLLAFALLLVSVLAHASAVFDVNIHNRYSTDFWTLTGQLTTAGTDYAQGEPILSFTGTFSDIYELGQPVTLIPTGQTVCASATCDSVFLYDNLFFGPTNRPGYTLADSFDSLGWLLNAGLTDINLYSESDAIGYTIHRDFYVQILLVDGTITPVPEPADWALYGCSFALFFIVRQFLIRWGLAGNKTTSGDFGLSRLFSFAAYCVLWVLPTLAAFGLLRLWRAL